MLMVGNGVDLITSICAGLVLADKPRNMIRLVHHTAHEYFERVFEDQSEEINLELCTMCLTYLCYREFKPKDAAKSKDEDEDSPQPFQLVPSWKVHHNYNDINSQTGAQLYTPRESVSSSHHGKRFSKPRRWQRKTQDVSRFSSSLSRRMNLW